MSSEKLEPRVMLTIRVPASLRQRARIEAARRGVRLGELVAAALSGALPPAERSSRKAARP